MKTKADDRVAEEPRVAQNRPESILIEMLDEPDSLHEKENVAEGYGPERRPGATNQTPDPAESLREIQQKFVTAVEGLRSVEQWARRDNWDLRQRVIKTLKSIGEWNV